MLHHGHPAPARHRAGGERDLGPGVGGARGAAGAISSTLATFIKPRSCSQLQITTYFLQFIFLVISLRYHSHYFYQCHSTILPLHHETLHSTHLAYPLQADVEAGLATPGAVLDAVVEPLHDVRVIQSLAVQTAGRLRLFSPHPEVTVLSSILVEGPALLVPQ